MIKKITIKDDSQYDDAIIKRLHFTECETRKFNILFGGNGSGKSTLLRTIERKLTGKTDDECEMVIDGDKEVVVHTFYNGTDNVKYNNPSPFAESNTYARELAERMHSNYISEGQGIIYTFTGIFYEIEEAVRANPNKHHVILLDEMDSGLSCDHVNVVMHIITGLLQESNVQVFVATNMYHWVYASPTVLSMYTGKFIEVNSYDEYFKIQMDMQRDVGKKSDFNFFR